MVTIEAQKSHFFTYIHQFAATPAGGTGVITAGQIGASDQVQVSGDGDFRIIKRALVWSPASGGQVKVQFEQVPGETLLQVPTFVSALGGGRFPQYLREPRTIRRGALFRTVADDRQTVAAAVTLRIAHIGERVFPKPFEPPRAYAEASDFHYTADFTAQSPYGALAANGTIPLPIPIQSDHDFQIAKLAIVCDSVDLTIDVVTSGKNMGWFNKPCYAGLLAATTFDADPPAGAWPFILPRPVWVPASGSIVVTAADFSGAANRVQVVVEGRRLKPPGGLPMDQELMERLSHGHHLTHGHLAAA